ncbi:MAG TPA: efflux RND transporter periplasmic adaptor subunit [Pirellulaceae bacterium]|nr:efflux RND transporter periplasmic adaptor subunit [Pirellulaceae bacterium]
MSSRNTSRLTLWWWLPLVGIVGLLVGLSVPYHALREMIVQPWRNSESIGLAQSDEHDDHEHVVISPTVRKSLGIQIAPATLSNYQAHFEIHAFVQELPGTQGMRISNRFSGVVLNVYAIKGSTIRPGDPLCQLELTGEELIAAQSQLLDAVIHAEIARAEYQRLEPLLASGGVAGRRLIELEYERQRYEARVSRSRQELLMRGLNASQVEQIIESRQLIRQVTVSVPAGLLPPLLNADEFLPDGNERYLVEEVLAKPGQMLAVGDDLCLLSYHDVLAIEGHAFEKDLPILRELLRTGTPINLSIGPDARQAHIYDQRIAFIGSHADEATNSFPFYVYFRNEHPRADDGRAFLLSESGGRWKPGQRAHVHIPHRSFQQQIVVPRDAVAIDGIRHVVFRWQVHDHDHDSAGSGHVHLDEFTPVEVHVLHLDRQSVVIEPTGELAPGALIAISGATQLLFAWQAQQSGAIGHSHEH